MDTGREDDRGRSRADNRFREREVLWSGGVSIVVLDWDVDASSVLATIPETNGGVAFGLDTSVVWTMP